MNASLVSLYPLEFHEFVPFLFPSVYHIDPSDGQVPQILHVDDAFYLIPNPTADDYPPIKVQKSGLDVASSLLYDFRQSTIHRDDNAYPAVFVVPGEQTVDSVLKSHAAEIKRAVTAQNNWFRNLVRVADDDWQRYRQHRVISDLHRIAAKHLKLDREWAIIDTNPMSCPACGNTVNAAQAVCGNCRCIINPEAYKNLQFAKA